MRKEREKYRRRVSLDVVDSEWEDEVQIVRRERKRGFWYNGRMEEEEALDWKEQRAVEWSVGVEHFR